MREDGIDWNLVACIRATRTDENVVLGRQVEGYIALTFAAVGSTYEYVDLGPACARQQAQSCGAADFDVRWGVTRSVDHHICPLG